MLQCESKLSRSEPWAPECSRLPGHSVALPSDFPAPEHLQDLEIVRQIRDALYHQSGPVRLQRFDTELRVTIRPGRLIGTGSAPLTPGCGLCGKERTTEIARFRGFRIGQCVACRTTRVLEFPPTSDDRTNERDGYADRYESERRQDKSELCWQLFTRETNGLQDVSSVLDIGCGQGAFLDLALRVGLKTAGIELSLESATQAVMRGHEVLWGSATECAFPPEVTFDSIVMWDVLEHMDQPSRALRLALTMLRSGGQLFIVTPKMGSIFDRIGLAAPRLSGGRLDHLARMCWNQNHLYRFVPEGLCGALRRLGYARVTSRPLQMLSLQPDKYAGGLIFPGWTGSAWTNRQISLLGVRCARALGLANKVFVKAVGRERDDVRNRFSDSGRGPDRLVSG